MKAVVESINAVARHVDHLNSDTVVRVWAVASLANALGVRVYVTSLSDPVDAMTEFGQLWAADLQSVLAHSPGRPEEIVQATRCVVQSLLTSNDRTRR